MGVFGPGFLLDPSTMLPVAGRVVAVTDPDTGEPVTTTEADGTTPRTVVTNLHGHYPQFHAAGTWAVLLSAGGVEEVVAAIDRDPSTSLLRGAVESSSELPADATDGDAYLALDTQHTWVRSGGEWVDAGPIAGSEALAAAQAWHEMTTATPDLSGGRRRFVRELTGDESLSIPGGTDGDGLVIRYSASTSRTVTLGTNVALSDDLLELPPVRPDSGMMLTLLFSGPRGLWVVVSYVSGV